MAYVKIEPSGCCERKGLVQVRLVMYLDEDDYGYEKHHVQVPDITSGKYKGNSDLMSHEGADEYKKWLMTLPKVWQTNPFHNHFIWIEPDTTNEEIMNIAEAFLNEAYSKWATDNKLDLVNSKLPFKLPLTVDKKREDACAIRFLSVKELKTVRKINGY